VFWAAFEYLWGEQLVYLEQLELDARAADVGGRIDERGAPLKVAGVIAGDLGNEAHTHRR
jgi:hypothetical protein